MVKDKLIWSGKRIMERWGISSTELGSWIYNGLPAYQMIKGEFLQIPPEEINQFDEKHMTDFVFRPSDIESCEEEHDLLPLYEQDESKLSANDAKELGKLREEKFKWDSSIVAAVQVGTFCASFGRPVVRREVDEVIMKIDAKIPNTTMDKIWKALPNKYKKGAGRPRNE